MQHYIASNDPHEKRLESFWNIFRANKEILVKLPDRIEPIRIPTERETDSYWFLGPHAFSSAKRFEEVRAYMRHYFIDADSAKKYWEQNERIAVEIGQFLAKRVREV